MDKPQSWTFLLSMNPMTIPDLDKKTRTNQDSPLRLASKDEALAFGNKMFEPPLSVDKWVVVGSMNKPNFPFKK